ncbi:very short patch repair endonuclease [Corallococcus sp. AB004]|nr:very short patch repair endonuclease [Corallococcus sp. AB004]
MALSRSEQMARIRGKHTTPEKLLRAALWRKGLRYRLHVRLPAGRPDVIFPRQALAIFIDGCFWHGCPDHYVRPRSRSQFWATKLTDNVERDRRQTALLESQGWRVIRIWEHMIFEQCEYVVDHIQCVLSGQAWPNEDEWRIVCVDVLDATHDLERRHLSTLRPPFKTRVVDTPRMTTKWKRQTSSN